MTAVAGTSLTASTSWSGVSRVHSGVPGHRGDQGVQHRPLLAQAQRRALARRAERDQAIDPGLDQPARMLGGAPGIGAPAGGEGRQRGGVDAGNHRSTSGSDMLLTPSRKTDYCQQVTESRELAGTRRFSPDELVTLGGRALAALGAPADIAAQVARSLVLSNLVGHDSHGVIRLAQYAPWIADGQIRPAAAGAPAPGPQSR